MGEIRHPKRLDLKGKLQVAVSDGLNISAGDVVVDEDYNFTFTSTIDFTDGIAIAGDGIKAFYGSNLVMSTRYDASDDDLKWRDEGNTTDRMALDRTSGDLTIAGTLDETSTP